MPKQPGWNMGAPIEPDTNKEEGEREPLQRGEFYEGGPDLFRRGFLRGLGAAIAASAAPTEIVEAAAKAVEPSPRLLAMERATNVWHLLESYHVHYGPNDFQDLRAEAIQHLTDLAKDLEGDLVRDIGRKIRAYRDAARLLESAWPPPARLLPTWTRTTEDHGVAPEEPHQASAPQQKAERTPPEGQTLPGAPHEAVPTGDVKEPQITAIKGTATPTGSGFACELSRLNSAATGSIDRPFASAMRFIGQVRLVNTTLSISSPNFIRSFGAQPESGIIRYRQLAAINACPHAIHSFGNYRK
jgi:hypothetical protein